MVISVRSISRRSARAFLVGGLIAFASAGAPSRLPASAAEYTPSAAERRAQINRVLDGLNSPDPTTRIIMLEEATASKDGNIRRIALSTALASSDPDLRGAALVAAVRSAPMFVVELTATTGSDSVVRSGTGGGLEVRISRFDRSANTFRTSSRYAAGAINETGTASQGAISGDRLSFSINLFQLDYECSGVARLQGGTASLKGTMGCTRVRGGYVYVDGPLRESYEIKIDVPK